MPIIRVEMFPDRTSDQKCDRFVRACGSAGDRLDVVITEVEHENWDVGGEPMSPK